IGAHLEREAKPLQRALDRELPELAVALTGMAVTRGEEGAVNGDRQVEDRPRHEQVAVDVAAPDARRLGRVDAGFRRRHPEDTRERPQLDLAPVLVATDEP